MSFAVIDWIFLGLIFIFAFGAMAKGFVDEFFGKAAWVLGILGGYIFYPAMAETLSKSINNVFIVNILSFLIFFIIVFLIVKIIGAIVGKLFELNILNSLDRALGFFFGIVEGLAIVLLIMFLIVAQPFFNADSLIQNSFFYDIFGNFVIYSKNELNAKGINANVWKFSLSRCY